MEFQGFFSSFKKDLLHRSRWRSLHPPQAVDLCSNDYLGFSESSEIQETFLHKMSTVPLGGGSSPLIRGQHPVLEQLEVQLAERCGVERALFFSSGYQANLALYSTFPKEAVVFSDRRNHASIIDGLRLSRAQKNIFEHNSIKDLSKQLQACPSGALKFVIVESRYSMGGDRSPLLALSQVCEEHGAHLCVDEAHASGLHGKRGMGLVQELGLTDHVFARVHTAGKAFGVGGAWISGSENLIQFLTNTSRPFIYSTATSPMNVVLMQAALAFWDQVGRQRAEVILQRVQTLHQNLMPLWKSGIATTTYLDGPILPVVLGSEERALSASKKLLKLGYDVRAIRPPTVPEGESLLRVTLPWRTSEEKIKGFSHDLLNTLQGDFS